MIKTSLMCAVALGLMVGAAGAASAAGKKMTFALVPKSMNNPFYDQALAGCKKAETESTGPSNASISALANMAAATSRPRSWPT